MPVMLRWGLQEEDKVDIILVLHLVLGPRYFTNEVSCRWASRIMYFFVSVNTPPPIPEALSFLWLYTLVENFVSPKALILSFITNEIRLEYSMATLNSGPMVLSNCELPQICKSFWNPLPCDAVLCVFSVKSDERLYIVVRYAFL